MHARDIAAGVLDLAAAVDGILLPLRPADRRDFVVGLAVLIAYLHDVGMHDPTPAGRRIHAIYAAQIPFSGEMDDVLERLSTYGGPVVERIAAVDAVAPFGVPRDVVLRELIALAVAHSKSTVPAALLGRRHRAAEPDAARRAGRPRAPPALPKAKPIARRRASGRALARTRGGTRDAVRDAYAWLDSPHAAHRALADDAIDAVRLVRAADAMRQRGTTLKTAAGYEIFIDADTGEAVFALRTADNDRLLLLRVDSPLSAGEANLRGAFVTPRGNLRDCVPPRSVQFSRRARRRHGLRQLGSSPTSAPTCSGAFAVRRPSPDLPAPARRSRGHAARARASVRRPSFADAVADGVASHDAWLARASRWSPISKTRRRSSGTRYYRGIEVQPGSDEAAEILSALGACGLKEAAIDPDTAFEDVRRVRLDDGEVLVEAGSPPSFVYVALGPGLRVQPLGGYEAADVPALGADRRHGRRAPGRAQQHGGRGRTRRGADDPRRALPA